MGESDQPAWLSYIKFEFKYNEIERARGARSCSERAVDFLSDDEEAEQLFVAFTERARCIYEFAIDHIAKGRVEDLYRKFVAWINYALYEALDAQDMKRTRDVYR
ncbi:hypothetical protein LguiB_017740 [Lonicera macranthoides]